MMQTTKNIAIEQRLIMALDLPSIPDAREMVNDLGDSVHFYKIGLELFMTEGYFGFLHWLRQNDKSVFVDLKFFDVPATVGRAVRALSKHDVQLATIHGNDAIMESAAKEKDQLKILAVTVLTSLDRGDLDDLGFQCDVQQLVLSRARRALALGCDGVVSSGLEAPTLRHEIDHRLLIVSPGIRPIDNRTEDDQKRVVTVDKAFANGADHIVVGRPIRDADNPRQAAMMLQNQIADQFVRS